MCYGGFFCSLLWEVELTISSIHCCLKKRWMFYSFGLVKCPKLVPLGTRMTRHINKVEKKRKRRDEATESDCKAKTRSSKAKQCEALSNSASTSMADHPEVHHVS
ncbi:PREDICTED: uncharacterized protein LOC107342100 [Acropora digitifera]|uniref:uncharacterized protein LOC107342100 n=1 Tax=Acropora digitifera TaxID=70779 RepID=UPI00077A9655|nr:PREDICTED: uncharacterized protein LOC107342100 [Acropora digitifera]